VEKDNVNFIFSINTKYKMTAYMTSKMP